MGHFLVVGILVIVMAVLTYFGLDAAGLMPVQASAQAVSIDWLMELADHRHFLFVFADRCANGLQPGCVSTQKRAIQAMANISKAIHRWKLHGLSFPF